MITKKLIKPIIIVFFICFITINPYVIIQGIKNGMIICYETVIPSLFMFMVIANYCAQTDIINVFSIPLRWYTKLMKVESKDYSGYLLLSLMGGFATGAKLIDKMKNSGYDEKTVSILGIPMINNSFAFCVFAAGAGMLNNYFVGLLFFISTASASFITAFIYSFFVEYNIVLPQNILFRKKISFPEAVSESVSSILTICGFILISSAVCEVISFYMQKYIFLKAFLTIFIEITVGCAEIIQIFGKNMYFLCICLSILPICTICQVYCFTNNTMLVKNLVISRIFHTPISLIIFTVLTNLFPVSCITAANSIVVKNFYYTSELSFVFFAVAFIFVITSDKNILFTKPE